MILNQLTHKSMKAPNSHYRTLLLCTCIGCLIVLFPKKNFGQERMLQHPKIEQFLNHDGSLKTSIFSSHSNSIDPRDREATKRTNGILWSVQQAHSLPFYARSGVPEDEFWDGRFGGNPGSAGVDDEIFAMDFYNSQLYAGGAFTVAGNRSVNNLVSWNGSEWRPVGSGALNGVNGFIYALDADDGLLFIGGQFDTAGTIPSRNIAFYDIQAKSWHDMGGVTSSTGAAFVSSIIVDGDKVYVGGTFDRAGNVSAKNIAVYSRAAEQWRALGSGTEGNVNAIAIGPDGIYVGGSFSSAGGIISAGIARWDGSEWHGLGKGVQGFVNAIAVMGDVVFVAGGFDRAGDTLVNNIARWQPNNATWTRLSGTFWLSGGEPMRLEGNGVNNVVRSLAVNGQELYVGGTFLTAFPEDYRTTSVTVNYIARWHEFDGDPLFNTLWWGRLGRGTNGFVNALTFDHSNNLYAAGSFSRAGSETAHGIAKWDGRQWFSLRTGTGNNIFTLSAKNGEVWVGGAFHQPGAGIGSRLAKLDYSQGLWDLVPGKFSGSIRIIAIKDEWIYVGGQFHGVGAVSSSNIIRYNTTTQEWSKLGASNALSRHSKEDNAYVTAIAFQDDYVYVGGNFTNVNGMPTFSIARWNSVTDTWDSVGRGINGQVFAIVPDGEDLYVGGRFVGAGELLTGPARRARNMARWTNGAWATMKGGTDEVVWDMALDKGKIYVGGNFDSAGTLSAKRVAAWDIGSEEWENLGEGLTKHFVPTVSSLSTNGEYIYAGGNFAKTGFDSLSNIARWDGSRWNPLGSGVDRYVYEVDVDDNKVYVAGAFVRAGGKSSFYFGIYSDPILSVEDQARNKGVLLSQVTPNPFLNETTIQFQTSRYDHVSLKIFDINGKQVARLIDNALPAGDHRILWEPDQEIPSGVYVLRLETGESVLAEKIIRQ